MKLLSPMKRIQSFFGGSNFWNRFILAQISGVLIWIAFPNVGAHSGVSWICFSFWLLALRQAGWKERIFHGLAFSLWYALPDKWEIIWQLSSDQFSNRYFAFLFVFVYFAGYILPFLVFSGLAPRWTNDRLVSIFNRCALLTVLIAWTPTLFPIYPAVMIHDWPIAMQTADLGGIYMVVFLLLWVNFLWAEMAVLAWSNRRRFGYCSLFLALTILFMWGYGAYRIHELKQMETAGKGHSTRMAVLNPRFSPDIPLEMLTRQLPKGGYSAMEMTELSAKHFPEASVIVWPELPIGINPGEGERLQKLVSALAIRLQKSIIYCSSEIVDESTPANEYCTARLILPDGTEGGKYRKSSLIPFYEYTPFPRLSVARPTLYQAGEEDNVLPLDDKTLAIPSLCYDLHNIRHLRNSVQRGGNIIVHMSNFHAFHPSIVPLIDLTMAKFYAIEYRVPIARSTNWGYGAFIQATGETVKNSLTIPMERKIKSFPLFIPDTRSIYYSIGDLFLYVLTGWVIWIGTKSRIVACIFRLRA